MRCIEFKVIAERIRKLEIPMKNCMSARNENKLCHNKSGGTIKSAAKTTTLSWYYAFCLRTMYSYLHCYHNVCITFHIVY